MLLEAYLDYDQNPDSPARPSGQTIDERIKDLVPDWLHLTEVTNDKNFSMFSIADRNGRFVSTN